MRTNGTTNGDLVRMGAKVRQARTEAGLSQAALARATGMDYSTVSRIESGSRELGVLAAVRIARVLGTSVERLA